MLARAALAAAAAFLIAGDLAALGPAALGELRRWLLPFFWIFLALELLRERKGLEDEQAFLVGGALGLLYDGVYVKALQGVSFFLNVNWLAAVFSFLDWGVLSILSLHLVAALRRGRAPRFARYGLPVFLALSAVMVLSYLSDAASGLSVARRELGAGWLLSDLLLMGASAFLLRKAWQRHHEHAHRRPNWLWAVCGLSLWLPVSQLLNRLSGGAPGIVFVALLVLWTGFALWFARRFRAEVEPIDPQPAHRSRPLMAAAAWRFVGAYLVWRLFDPAYVDPFGGFQLLVELPTRLAFAYVVLGSRVEV